MSDLEVVATLLAAAGLEAPPDELAELATSYPKLRAGLDLLYAAPFTAADPYLVPSVTTELRMS